MKLNNSPRGSKRLVSWNVEDPEKYRYGLVLNFTTSTPLEVIIDMSIAKTGFASSKVIIKFELLAQRPDLTCCEATVWEMMGLSALPPQIYDGNYLIKNSLDKSKASPIIKRSRAVEAGVIRPLRRSFRATKL